MPYDIKPFGKEFQVYNTKTGENIGDLHKKRGDAIKHLAALKINVDGGDDKHNALYIDGYSDKPDIIPNPIIPVDIINDVVRRADSLGIDVASHCFGDVAVRIMLDAIE